MNRRILSLSLILSLGCFPGVDHALYAQTIVSQPQNGQVSGVVTGSDGVPLIGATVTVKGTNRRTVSDTDGHYAISARPGETLVVSYVGFENSEIKLKGGKAVYDVQLASSTDLDEVVVTAMGVSRERKSLGYAVEDLNSKELMLNKSNNVLNSLSGKMSGVSITQASGAAGAGTQIILRGGTSLERDNQPLFVVDGIIYDNSTSIIGNSAFDGMTASATTNSNRVMDINPEDIENVSVLKGPAASALYGSRAAAGVVIITTKKKVARERLKSTSIRATPLPGHAPCPTSRKPTSGVTTRRTATSTTIPHSRGAVLSRMARRHTITRATSSKAAVPLIPMSASPADQRTISSSSPDRCSTRTVSFPPRGTANTPSGSTASRNTRSLLSMPT